MKRIVLLQDRLMTYQDSGFSEEDQDHQVTTCLMKTPSGSIYIQPTSKMVPFFTYIIDNIQILETRISITITPAHKQDAINMDEKFILCVVDI